MPPAAALAPSVLVIGESIMDVVRVRGDEVRHPGGSPMNVAYGLARLGIDTRLLTRLGRDSDGEAIWHHLAGAGVSVLEESRSEIGTSTAIATLQPDGSASYDFDVTWSLSGFAGVHLAKWVHIGSIATFLSPGANSLEQLLRALSGRISISYDPNIRASLIGDHQDALRRFERIARLAKVVKLSDEDAAWLYPGLDEEFVMDRILSLGVKVAAITRGSAGARIAVENYSAEAPAPHIEVADTIGAGDSFMAALIAGVCTLEIGNLTNIDLGRVLNNSLLAAAITCSRPGAQPPTADELRHAIAMQSPA